LDDGKSDQRTEHVHERHDLQHDGQRKELLKSFLNAGAEKIHDDEKSGNNGLDDECGVGRGVARMNLAEPGGHVGIEAGDEGNAGGAAHPGGTDAGDGEAEHERERHRNPGGSDAAGHVADGLHDSLKHVDVLADGDQERERGTDIESAGKDSAPGYRAGKRAAGILDFVSHDGGEFKADQTEADDAEGIENEARVGGNPEVGGSDGGAETRPDHCAETDQNGGGDESSNCAEVVDPLADAETDNVENGEQGKQCERSSECERFVIGESCVARAQDKDGDADEVEHDGRHVEHVVGPVTPAGEESVEVAEDFLRPEIDATLTGIAMSEFDDGDALRPEEKKKRDDPEPDGDAAVGRDGGDYVQVEDGNYEEEDEIAASEGAHQVGLGGGLGGGGQ